MSMQNKMIQKYKAHMPNCVTVLRIAGTICLLFTAPLGTAFLIIYTLTGLTDVLDGWIARKTGTASEFGARLDSIADLLFYAVMLIRLFPLLWTTLPVQIWYSVGGTVLLRLLSYAVAAVKYRKFASLHTYLNKLTGAAVFTVPYILSLPPAISLCWAICVLAALSSAEELLIHLGSSSYRTDTKSLLRRKSGSQ